MNSRKIFRVKLLGGTGKDVLLLRHDEASVWEREGEMS